MSTKFKPYDRVRVLASRFESEGVRAGTLGYVIERYPDGALEVEVSDPATGETIATVVTLESELEHAPEPG